MKPSFLRSIFFLIAYLPLKMSKNFVKFATAETYIKNIILISFGIGVGYAEWMLFDRLWNIVAGIPFGFQLILPNLFTYAGSFLFIFLAYSSVLTSLTSLYRSRDLPLLLVLPNRLESVLFYKWIDIGIRSAMTLVALMIPVMLSIGLKLSLPIWFYVAFMFVVIALSAIGVSLGVIIAMLMMLVFPVKRLNQTVAILGLLMASFLVFGLRFLHLETLWGEQAQQNPLILFLQNKPSGWVQYGPGRLFSLAMHPAVFEGNVWNQWLMLSIGAGVGCLLISLIFGRFIFMHGWWKSQEQQDQSLRKKGNASSRWINWLPLPMKIRSMFWKDYVIFTRDPSVWTQLLMMVPLAAMYLLNLLFLPDLGETAAPFMAVSNVGLIALIISAVGARFIFPTASREGLPVWIPFVSPLGTNSFILQKALFVLPPVLTLSLVLIYISSVVLDFRMSLALWSYAYGMGLITMIAVQSLCLGVWFPAYKHQHIMEVSLGKGAILFMVMALFQTASLIYLMVVDILGGTFQTLPLINMELAYWLIGCVTLTIITFVGAWRKMTYLDGIN